MSQRSQSALSKERRERERVAMVRRIKAIAREMFVRDGYDAVTLQGIADTLEYTSPAIYRYFKNKEQLLSAIVLEDMEDLHAKLIECARFKDPLKRLSEMGRRNAQWALDNPNHYLLFYSPAWRRMEDAVRAQASVPPQQEPLVVVYQAVEEMIARGMFRKQHDNPSLITRTLWAGMHGVIMLELTMSNYDKSLIRGKKTPIARNIDAMLDCLMQGMLQDSPPGCIRGNTAKTEVHRVRTNRRS